MMKVLHLGRITYVHCLRSLFSWSHTLQIEGPSNIPGAACTPRTRDHKSAHARRLGTTLVTLKANDDIMGLFTSDALTRLHIKTRTIHSKGKLCGV